MRKRNKEEIPALAEEIAKEFPRGALIALYGELGSGKTTLTKAIGAAALGLDPEEISSPTYTYMHMHEGLIHFDLWRLKSEEEFIAHGFEEYLTKGGFVIIEWAERIEGLLPAFTIRIQLC